MTSLRSDILEFSVNFKMTSLRSDILEFSVNFKMTNSPEIKKFICENISLFLGIKEQERNFKKENE